ncbi:sigma-70 family RNA polymerase sigma factor [Intestinibacillus sp. Marseille-P6563]|uniref:sigma-70 family RNA polymerase sigma factor n=1 Tax=Intestinibacillus sp. Marseille-P6563 TaxID=2364792 RepID=UPI001FA9F113|nr:sigma-70 family RNA polymerase sigma factor [Intestinibacillus sp. Marseille-P6563]
MYSSTKSAAFFSGFLNNGTGGRHLRFVFAKQIGGRKMYDYRKSDYAINKNSPNIVYRFHNEILEITLEDYLKENPDKTEKDFAELKALSDQIYYEQDRAESAQTRKDDSLTGLEETQVCATRPLDEEWEEKLTEFQNRLYARRAFEKLFEADVLTEIQKRRFCLYVFKGLSIRQIGRLEGRSHQVVAKSLNLAIRKLKKFFAEQG